MEYFDVVAILNRSLVNSINGVGRIVPVRKNSQSVQRIIEDPVVISEDAIRCSALVSAHRLAQYTNIIRPSKLRDRQMGWFRLLLHEDKEDFKICTCEV